MRNIKCFSSMWGSSKNEELLPQHQVYINCHEDVRSGFVSHLVNALERNKIKVLMDADEQDPTVVLQRIEESRIALVIFSGKYTESNRVLRELQMISDRVDKRQLVAIPIFYQLDPSTVKGLRGQFGDAFRNQPEDDESKDMWKKALMSIYNKNGIVVEKGRNENRILEIIVEVVKTVLKQIPSDRRQKNKTIGIKQRLKESGQKLNLNIIKSQLGLISTCLLLFLLCLQHISYTKSIHGPITTTGDNVTHFPNNTLINPPIEAPPMYCEVKPPQIQVFINFRGVDVRNNFVVYLVEELQRRGVNVFIDNLERRGKDLYTLFKRIEESGIAIVVFSRRYTQSNWCLDELVKIKECVHQGKLEVLPIFYKVDPTKVKELKGEFGDHFRDKENKLGYDSPLIQGWKETIVFVTHRHALVFDENSHQPENHFVKTIVKEVLEMLHAYSDDPSKLLSEKAKAQF